jgi:hypothetical protein
MKYEMNDPSSSSFSWSASLFFFFGWAVVVLMVPKIRSTGLTNGLKSASLYYNRPQLRFPRVTYLRDLRFFNETSVDGHTD